MVFAHEEALQHYERARSCAEALELADRVATIEEAIGDVNLRRGHLDAAAESYQRALGDERAGGRRPMLNLKIGRTYARYGDARGPDFLHAALEALDRSTQASEVAQAMAMLGRYEHYAGRHGEAIALLERAHVLAEPLDDAVTLTEIYRFRAAASQHLMRMADSMTWARKSIALGERRRAPSAVALGYSYLSQDLYFLGRWRESLEWSDQCLQIAQRIGAEARQAWAWHDRARALYGKSDIAAAAGTARRAVTSSVALGDRRVEVFARAILACAAIDLGADTEALEHARTAITAADALGDFFPRMMSRHALAYARLQREEWRDAAAAVDEWTAILSGSDHVLMCVVGGGYAAEALLRAGRSDEATEMAHATADAAARAGASHYEAVAQRVSAQILAAEERWDEAARAFDDAVKTLESTGSRLEFGRALFHRGLVRERCGRARTAARADLAHACAIFDEIGAVRDLERVRRSM